MKNKSLDSNAIMALNQLKFEIAKKMGIDPGFRNKERDLSGTVENIYTGGHLGGNMVRRMIEMSEKNMIHKEK